ncbi:MAG: DUF3021 family protein [Lachnospiraceae bacterium]|nr:DUF3021 family protein [Lachnospiraceae bacterium]
MKKLLRDTCILSALMIFSVFTISILWSGVTAEIILVLELFGLSLLIALVNTLCDEVLSLSILGSYLLKYFVVTGIVMLYGFIVGWFFRSNFWMAAIYVAVVFVLAYLLDSFRTKKDLKYINEQIKAKDVLAKRQ